MKFKIGDKIRLKKDKNQGRLNHKDIYEIVDFEEGYPYDWVFLKGVYWITQPDRINGFNPNMFELATKKYKVKI